MPTTGPRVLVTETDELSAALAAAARVWPDETSRSRLLSRLAIAGSLTLTEKSEQERTRPRRRALVHPRESLRGCSHLASVGRCGRVAGVIVLDASALIAVLDADEVHHDAMAASLDAHASDDWLISALTLAEVLTRAAADPERAADVGEHLAELDLTVKEVRDHDAEELAVLRHRTWLRMPDCFVLLVAARTGGAVLTTDQRLAGETRRLGLEVADQVRRPDASRPAPGGR